MTLYSKGKLRLRFWILLAVGSLVAAIPPLWLTGVIRPSRPLFHSIYATPLNSERLPHWVPDTPIVDSAGNAYWFDLPMNLVILDLASERRAKKGGPYPASPAPQGEQWLKVPYYGWVSVPADPRDLLIVIGDTKVSMLAALEPGDAAVVHSIWAESGPDALQDLIENNRIPFSVRTALQKIQDE